MRNKRGTACLKALGAALLCLLAALAVSYAGLCISAWLRLSPNGGTWGQAAQDAFARAWKPLVMEGGFLGGAETARVAAAESATLAFAGLSVALCLRIGLLNWGVPAQYALGLMGAWGCAAYLRAPWYAALAAAMGAGAALGAACGWLHNRSRGTDGLGVILLDAIVLYAILAVTQTQGVADGLNRGVTDVSFLPALSGQQDSYFARPATVALLLMGGAAALIFVLDAATVPGYHRRLMGGSLAAAAYAGVKTRRMQMLSLIVSGALAGLGGGCSCLSGLAEGIPVVDASLAGLGAALLANGHPLGTPLAAAVIAHIRGGVRQMDAAFDPGQCVFLIGSVLLPICACWMRILRKAWQTRRRNRKEARHEAVD